MIRVSQANVFAKRTLKPLHEQHQATPTKVDLDTAETGSIYSGMVAAKTSTGGAVKVADGNVAAEAARPFGLFSLDKNSVIDDLDGQPTDLRPFAIWQGGPDAYFIVRGTTGQTPIDLSLTFAVGDKLYPGTGSVKGKLVNSTSGLDAGVKAIAEVTRVLSQSSTLVELEIRVAVPTAL